MNDLRLGGTPLDWSLPLVDRRIRTIDARCEAIGRTQIADFGSVLAGAAATPSVPARSAGGVEVAPSDIESAIDAAAREHGLDPNLLRAVVHVESGGNPLAESPAGAQGLMQLMPETARDLGVTEPFDPMQNIRGGASYLRSLLDRFGDPRLALAAYNAGPGAVERAHGIPPFPETRAYVERVTREAARLALAS